MKLFAGNALLLRFLIVAASLAIAVPQASADSLFRMLFGGGIKNQKRLQEFPAPPKPRKKAPRAAAPVARISGPSYYTYRADALSRVDFSPLAAIGQSAALDGGTVGNAFRQSVAGLEGFELLAEAKNAKALIERYAAVPDFVWVTGDEVNERARAVLRTLGEAGSHGMSASDYSVVVPSGTNTIVDIALRRRELIRFEMALSARLLRYIADAEGGRVDPNRISGYHDLALKPLDLVARLNEVALAADPREWLELRHPQSPEYKALRVELEALRASAENEIVVDPKLLLKPGETSPELAKLLRIVARDLDDELGGEFGELLARLAASETYVPELVPVIKAVQRKARLSDDGVIGPRTVAALAGQSKAGRIEKVEIALEQLRWLPSELGSTRVFINQPAYTARYIEDGIEKLHMRVVVGKPSNQTSFFYDEIEQVDYNPYWGVPQSIIVNEMLPRLRRDPGYLDRAGYEVVDARGRRISSSAVNWGAYGAKVPFGVRQTPSEANALGELKILFPNKHAIYMHDTPQKELFDRDMRAFSHGCVRLKDPRGMAAAVLGVSVEHIAEKLKRGHSSEKVTRKIPVYVAYFTAWPDRDGRVEYFEDVYGRDARLEAAFDKTDAARAPSS